MVQLEKTGLSRARDDCYGDDIDWFIPNGVREVQEADVYHSDGVLSPFSCLEPEITSIIQQRTGKQEENAPVEINGELQAISECRDPSA